jgi:hypothetical protein
VLDAGEPARGVLVRVVRHDVASSTATDVSTTARTDATGAARVAVDDPVPGDAWLETAFADASGARHGLAPLAEVVTRGAEADAATVALPAGGSLRVEVRGLPAGVRARRAVVHLQPPYGEFLGLFEGARVAAADGGPTETGALPSAYPVTLDERGDGRLAHVPDTFAVAVSVEGVPEGFVVEEVGCTAPAVAASEGRVLRVSEGTECVYTLRWKALPEARVRVTDEAGAPIAGARVAIGTAAAGASPRLSPQVATTDAAGSASLLLWSGSHLPAWLPEGHVVVASAPGRLASVTRVPGGRWYGVEASAALAPSPGGSFRVAGTLRFPGGGPAAGVPVTLAARAPWDGHRALAPFETVTDADGAWSFVVPEDARPVFDFAGGLRLHVDGDRLEDGPAEAVWRTRWPSLPRAATAPEWLALPPPRGAVSADLTLVLPP